MNVGREGFTPSRTPKQLLFIMPALYVLKGFSYTFHTTESYEHGRVQDPPLQTNQYKQHPQYKQQIFMFRGGDDEIKKQPTPRR